MATPSRDKLAADWSDFQQAYTFAHDRVESYRLQKSAKYGTGVAVMVYGSKREREHLAKLERAEHRVYERIFRFLDAYSPWDWHAGTSAHWICTKLTAKQALSMTPPVLPAESAGYGSPAVVRLNDTPSWKRQAQIEVS